MPPSASDASSSKKKSKERLSTCSYCPMTFKKLEHAQRHERTHTLDRPYSCDTCGKTFARQDTLHRHTRLHSRTSDEAPAVKGPKKRRASTSSVSKAPLTTPKSPKPSSSSSSGSSSSIPANKVSPSEENGVSLQGFSSSSAAFGLSMSLPMQPPSFPAYSEPAHSFHSTSGLDADFPSFGNSDSINPAILPLHSGLGHAATSYSSTRIQPTRRATVGGSTLGSTSGGGGPGSEATFPDGMSRPRALTLAGLPEGLGCFSLITSPASSTASLPREEGEEDDDEVEEDDDDEYRDSSMEVDLHKAEKEDPTFTVDSPNFPPAPESHYPSPAFSSYSPSALHTDSLTDLQAILDNDPIPSSAFKAHQRKSSKSAQQPQLATVPEPDFDFEAFAASIEGGEPSTAGVPSSYDELLGSQRKNGAGRTGGLFDRYPTPPTDPMTTLALPTSDANEFDWLNNYTATPEAQQQAREDAAATAAMFSRGFGLDPAQTSAQPSSALGLSLGLPSPPLTAMAIHAHTIATSTAPTSVSSSPHISFPMSAPATFTNLHATYASTYPTFSLASASIVPTPLQSAPVSHPSISMPVSSPSTTTSPSLHDLLAAAWERRQRQPTPSAAPASSALPVLPPSINLKATQQQDPPPPKQTPAFYIPSALHSSASQIGTATNVDSLAGLVKASGPLSLPIPTWASVVPEL